MKCYQKFADKIYRQIRHIYWLTKETLRTFFANSSNRNIEIWYLLYSNKWINATVLFAIIVTVVYD